MSKTSHDLIRWNKALHWRAIPLSSIAAILTVYVQVKDFSFVNYDDPNYVLQNPFVKGGLSLENIYCAVTETHAANWHPMTWLSQMIDCDLYGLNPNIAKAYYNLGLLLSKEGQTDAAIKHFELSLKIRPETAKAHNALATRLIEKKLLDDAIFHYKEAVRLDPKFIDAQNNLAIALLIKGKYSEAIRLFQTVLKNDPHHQKARNNLKIALNNKK